MDRRSLLFGAATAPVAMALTSSTAQAAEETTVPPVTDDYALRDETPSLEEIAVSVPLVWNAQPPGARATDLSNAVPNVNAPLLLLPFPWRVLSVEFLFDLGGNLAASDSDFWEFRLLNAHLSKPTQVIGVYNTRTLAAGGGGPITGRRRWAPSVVLDPNHRVVDVGGCLYLQAGFVGRPPSLTGPMLATVRYARA